METEAMVKRVCECARTLHTCQSRQDDRTESEDRTPEECDQSRNPGTELEEGSGHHHVDYYIARVKTKLSN